VTELLDLAFDTKRSRPPERQDEIARMVLLQAGHGEPVIQLTPEEDASLTEADRGEFATDDEVRAVLAKYPG